ncbi:ABC transporter permease [Aminobacter aganoensis]|uniref:Simple sugar transport system permease protein n=1 Tax=Aminobacter aganoensis TaxID=83264 RepID=A0A7X0FCL3_9HYPH|nr:ABC transporter permease [Aminobacter aganoensis]MBB6357258.1 simple sugar transport system permease protein [Aminobacter aganoensis]
MSTNLAPPVAAAAPPPATITRLLPRLKAIAISGIACAAALMLGGLLFKVSGVDPLAAYATMLEGAFGSWFAFAQVLTRTVPLLIIAVGLIAVFRANIWNIGAEGQFLIGALAGGFVAIEFPVESGWLSIPCAMLAGFAAGGCWGAIVGWLRAKWEVHEVITSLLLNFIAALVFSYLIRGPLRDPMGFLPQSKDVPAFSQLPFIPGLGTNIGLLVALALVALFAYLLSATPYGMKIRMIGSSASVARAVGVDPSRMTIELMVISGGLAGLAGVIQVLGVQYALLEGLSPGFGFTAIMVALLGRLHPVGALAAAVVLSAITVGGNAMQITHGIPASAVATLSALLVLFLLVSDHLAKRARGVEQ